MNQEGSPSTSPPHPEEGNMTFDEASMQRSRHFVMALQELKSLRPQLYSAAEYCESSYLYSDQKQVVLDNLKDYSVKALVNAVDHLGTVACKLNDLLSQQTTEISTAEVRVACLAQRLRACQLRTSQEGLQQQEVIKTRPMHHKHYVLPDVTAGSDDQGQRKKSSSNLQDIPQQTESIRPVVDVGRSLSWHLATEARSNSKESSTNRQQTARKGLRSSSSAGTSSENLSIPVLGVGLSSFKRAAVSTPGSNTPSSGHERVSSVESSRSLSSLLSFDDSRRNENRHVPTRSKSMLSSFLGRRRSGKERNTDAS